jgi:hypothetical protein
MLPGPLRVLHARPRWSRDYYVEPAWCVQALFEAVPFSGPVHDPACGSGTIVHVARALGYEATGSDLVARGFCEGGIDFLADDTRRRSIVTNPPFVLAERFIHHALAVAERVAVIVPLAFSAGQRRCQSLFLPHPPALELVLAKRPSMPPGGMDIPAKGGTTDYSWLIWDRGHGGPTVKRWWMPSPPSGRTDALLSEAELEQDAIGSYYAGIAEIGERVRAGEPVPAFLLPKRDGGAP